MARLWYFFFHLLKLAGLAPMSWLKNPSTRKFFEFSSNGMIYNVVILIFHFIIHSYFIFGAAPPEDVHGLRLALFSFFIIIAASVMFITILTFVLKQGMATDVCNELYQIHQLIEIFDKDYRKKKVDTRQNYLTAFGIFSCFYFPIFQSLTGGIDLTVIFLVLDETMVSWIAIQYVWTVILMHGMIQTINEQFKNFDKTTKLVISEARLQNSFSIQKIGVRAKNQDEILAQDIFETLNNSNNKPQEVWSTKFARLEVLQHVFLKISDAATKFSEFYTFIMLGCVFRSFFGILTELYLIIEPVLKLKIPIVTDAGDVLTLSWLFWDIFLLLVITHFVTSMTTEVSREKMSKVRIQYS